MARVFPLSNAAISEVPVPMPRGDAPRPELPVYSDALAARYADRYARVARVMPASEWAMHLPWIAAIDALKHERGAVILAHNYQTPEIFHGVADITGDSLALAQQGARTDAPVIVMAGVHFMAETAKVLSPEKTVLMPDLGAGCSLAASITAADVRLLRERHPGVPIVSYVNTSAEVKAESDVCCTSANAVHVVDSLPGDRVIFLPDQYLGKYVAAQTKKKLLLWEGACEVHERFTGEEMRAFRASNPGVHVLAHPECPPDVLAEADFVGSTQAMVTHLGARQPKRVVMITECSMSDNVSGAFPDIEFTRPCNLCPHMKRITLPRIHHALATMREPIEIAPAIALRARNALQRMLDIGRREAA